MKYKYIFDGIRYYPHSDSITYVRQYCYTAVTNDIVVINDGRTIPMKISKYEI